MDRSDTVSDNSTQLQSNDPYRRALHAAWHAQSDPAIMVYERLVVWKGMPRHRYGARPKQANEGLHEALSAHFSICVYESNPLYAVFCTVGASRKMIPHSDVSTRDPRGMRFEYLMHAPSEHAELVCAYLLDIAEHPHIHQREIGPGYVMPIGEPIVPDSAIEYLYFTYPFLDDPHIAEVNPAGEIDHPRAYIQTLWVVPMTRGERDYLRTNGVEAFEEFLHRSHSVRYDAGFDRASYR